MRSRILGQEPCHVKQLCLELLLCMKLQGQALISQALIIVLMFQVIPDAPEPLQYFLVKAPACRDGCLQYGFNRSAVPA